MKLSRIAHDETAEDFSREIDATLNEGDKLVFYEVTQGNVYMCTAAYWPKDKFMVIQRNGHRTEHEDVEYKLEALESVIKSSLYD